MSFGYTPDCIRVGREVEFGDTHVTYEDVMPIHDAAERSFFHSSSTQGIGLDEYSSAVAGALYFRGMHEIDLNMPSVSMAMKLSHEELPDGWRLTAGIGSFKDFQGPNKKQMWYRIETMGDEVLVAIKSVKFILDKMDIFVEDNEPQVCIERNRKMYEKPMEPADCVRLTERLLHAANRAGSRTSDPLSINPIRRIGQ
jgi:hypothetical protein